MIKTINSYLSKDELNLAKEYWLIREPSLAPCEQCPNSTSTYADSLSETFLKTKKSVIEAVVGEPLLPTYSFSRMYFKSGLLEKHSDRPSCEVSVTLNILADKDWAIWFHPLKEETSEEDPTKKAISLITKPGDAVVYEGCNYSHWRDEYQGEKCMQVFLHYVRANGRYKSFAMDGRKYFGQEKTQAMAEVWA